MSFELFEKIIEELRGNLIYIMLYFQGEPLINKSFFYFVKYAVSKKIYTTTSTNAHFLDDSNCKQIIESGLDRIIISMDGMTQEAYVSYRVGGNITAVKSGISNLIYWRNKLNSSKPYTILQFLVLKSNEHQISEVRKFAKQQGIDELQLKSAQFFNYKNGNPLLTSIAKYSRYVKTPDGTYKLKNKLPNHCFRMWSSCVITWDGKVLPCCFDKDAKYSFGNINEQNFSSIWLNPGHQAFRNKILTDRKSVDICSNCIEGL
jgi:radical SAM protein with 4Fe4S-binding SPASM domain